MSLTVGGRLKQLSGRSGATVGVMLRAIGSGSTMAQCLASYSGLASGTVAEHLRVERSTAVPSAPTFTFGGGVTSSRSSTDRRSLRRDRRARDEELVILLGGGK